MGEVVLYQNDLGKVVEFHKAFSAYRNDEPTLVSDDVIRARLRLIQEELDELAAALDEGDLVNALKENCDLQYTVLGAFDIFGYGELQSMAFAEVHRSNMTKLGEDGKPVRRADGKIGKGPNYEPANMDYVFDAVYGQGASRRMCAGKHRKATGRFPQRGSIFQLGDFEVNGKDTSWKVDAAALTNKDWDALALMAQSLVPPYKATVGISPAGEAFAQALRRYAVDDSESNLWLMVDDVWNNEWAMSRYYDASLAHLMGDQDDWLGLVAFDRIGGAYDAGCVAVWQMGQSAR